MEGLVQELKSLLTDKKDKEKEVADEGKTLEKVNPEEGSDVSMHEDGKESSDANDIANKVKEFQKVFVSENELAEAFPSCTIDRIAKERELLATHFVMSTYLTPMIDRESEESSIYEFICPLCFKLMQKCVTTVCGHSYCEHCLDEYLIYKENCFVCDFNGKKHNKLRDKPLVTNFKVDDLIVQIIENCQIDSVKEDWSKRKKMLEEKQAKKKLGEVAVG